MTRMWLGVDPENMCRQHLLGEHKELHQLAGHLRAGNWQCLKGHHEQGQIEVCSMHSRHEAVKQEMLRRGYNHESPLGDLPNYLPDAHRAPNTNMDEEYNRLDLMRRCSNCCYRIVNQTIEDYINDDEKEVTA